MDKSNKKTSSPQELIQKIESDIDAAGKALADNKITKTHELHIQFDEPKEIGALKPELTKLQELVVGSHVDSKNHHQKLNEALTKEISNLSQQLTSALKEVSGTVKSSQTIVPPVIFPKNESLKPTLEKIAQNLETLLSHEDDEEEEEQDNDLTVRAEDADQNVTYFGEAEPGTSNDEVAWRIKRITQQGGSFRTEYPDGDSSFNFAWSKRAKLNYR